MLSNTWCSSKNEAVDRYTLQHYAVAVVLRGVVAVGTCVLVTLAQVSVSV